MEKPIAKYEAGKLWLDQGFADYSPSSRFGVWMAGACQASLAGHLEENGRSADIARQKQRECLEALEAHDREMEEG